MSLNNVLHRSPLELVILKTIEFRENVHVFLVVDELHRNDKPWKTFKRKKRYSGSTF